MADSPRYGIEITRDGIWPFPWQWSVKRYPGFKSRYGEALTKERARRKAVRAVRAIRSMERDDVETVFE